MTPLCMQHYREYTDLAIQWAKLKPSDATPTDHQINAVFFEAMYHYLGSASLNEIKDKEKIHIDWQAASLENCILRLQDYIKIAPEDKIVPFSSKYNSQHSYSKSAIATMIKYFTIQLERYRIQSAAWQ
jgi:hypothetical protein